MLVSIAIPFYNSESTLADAIRSVFAQTYTDWELILVDDGSKDKSLEIAKAVASADERVRVISDGRNLKLPGRLNQIAELARSEILIRMDSDDLMHPDRVAKQVAFLQSNTDVQVVGSNVITIDEHDAITGIQRRKVQGSPYAVIKNHFVVHPSVAYRTEWIRKNPYDAEYIRAEDLELWCRTVSNTKFAIMDEYLHFLRKIRTSRIDDYLRSNTTDLKIIDAYKAAMTPKQYRELRTKYLLKRYIHSLAHKTGLYYVVVKAKISEIDESVKRQGDAALEQVLKTPLPGINYDA